MDEQQLQTRDLRCSLQYRSHAYCVPGVSPYAKKAQLLVSPLLLPLFIVLLFLMRGCSSAGWFATWVVTATCVCCFSLRTFLTPRGRSSA